MINVVFMWHLCDMIAHKCDIYVTRHTVYVGYVIMLEMYVTGIWLWYHFSPSWNWEIVFFLSNNYKPILSVGKGKNLRNTVLANSHKGNSHDMNWNDMDI